MKFVLLFILCVGSLPLLQCDKNEFAVSIPSGFFQGFLDQILLPAVDHIVDLVGRSLPTDCCYKKGTIKLQITNLNMPEGASQSLATVVSSDDGMNFAISIGSGVKFHFKICEAAVRTCVTLFFCNDDVDLDLEFKLKLDLQATASDGALVLSAPSSSLQIGFPDTDGLCAFVKGIAKGVIGGINNDLNEIFPVIVNDILHVLSNLLQLNINIADAVQLSVVYSENGTGTSNVGLGVSGQMPIFSVASGKPTHNSPAVTIPNPLVAGVSNEETAYLTDSIPSNIIEAVYDTIPHKLVIDLYLQGNLFKLHVDITHPPTVSFTDNEGAFVTIKTRDVIQNGFVRIAFEVHTQIPFAIVHGHEGLYLELSPDDFVFNFTLLPPVDFKNFTGKIDQVVENFWSVNIPKLNNILAGFAIGLPPISYLSGPQFQSNNRYATASIINGKSSGSSSEVNLSLLNHLFDSPELQVQLNRLNDLMSQTYNQFIIGMGEGLAENLPETDSTIQKAYYGAKRDDPHFYCPPIPNFSKDTCPE